LCRCCPSSGSGRRCDGLRRKRRSGRSDGKRPAQRLAFVIEFNVKLIRGHVVPFKSQSVFAIGDALEVEQSLGNLRSAELPVRAMKKDSATAYWLAGHQNRSPDEPLVSHRKRTPPTTPPKRQSSHQSQPQQVSNREAHNSPRRFSSAAYYEPRPDGGTSNWDAR
jgi:hypothetical protein